MEEDTKKACDKAELAHHIQKTMRCPIKKTFWKLLRKEEY